MKVLVLGGGSSQLGLIRKIRELGHEAIVSDYYPDAPGKKLALAGELVSSVDVEGNIEVARKYGVAAVVTGGTDQPVLTVAKVNAALGLPGFIDTETALAVTNKKTMKEKLLRLGVPMPKFCFVEKDGVRRLPFDFPAVLKPLDSQGQRGVIRVENQMELEAGVDYTFSFTSLAEIVAEEYYPSAEITYSGWCRDARATTLLVTDRLRGEQKQHIGICTSHRFPSRFWPQIKTEVEELADRIAGGLGINNGPLYIQFLFGERGLVLNEVACRTGGAFEDVLAERALGFDLNDYLLRELLGMEEGGTRPPALPEQPMVQASVQLVFARPGRVETLGNMESLSRAPWFWDYRYNFAVGDTIPAIANATARAGHFVVGGADDAELRSRVDEVYRSFKLVNAAGENLVFKPVWGEDAYPFPVIDSPRTR